METQTGRGEGAGNLSGAAGMKLKAQSSKLKKSSKSQAPKKRASQSLGASTDSTRSADTHVRPSPARHADKTVCVSFAHFLNQPLRGADLGALSLEFLLSFELWILSF
jgi:hypothetical protein